MGKRKTYSAEFKARAVLELLREETSLTQVASEYGVHPNQLRRWKQTALEQLPSVFSRLTSDRVLERLTELFAQRGAPDYQRSPTSAQIMDRSSRRRRCVSGSAI